MAEIFSKRNTLYISYYVHGKRYRESLGLKDNRENRKLARKLRVQKEAEILNGIHPEIRKVRKNTLESAYREFIKTKENRSERTIMIYEYAYGKLVDFLSGRYEVGRVDSETVKEFEKFIEFSKKSKKDEPRKLSKNSIEIIFRHLRIIFEFYKMKRYIEENPFPRKEHTPKKINVIPKEELDLILRILKANDFEQYRSIKLLVLTGMRAGELIRLEFSDIDFKRNLIYIKNTKGRREDSFPLYNELREFLLNNWNRSERKGKVVKYKRVDSLKFFQRVLKRNNLKHYTIHEIRKTFLSRLANSGMSLFDLQKISRHKNLKTTEKYYLAAEYERIGEQVNSVIKDTIKDTDLEKSLKIVEK